MPSTSVSEWQCRCIPGYVEKGENCVGVPEGIFSDNELFPVISTSAAIGTPVLTMSFTKILDICTEHPTVTLYGDADLFEVVDNSCLSVTIRTTKSLQQISKIKHLMIKATFTTGGNTITDAILVTVTLQKSAGNIVIALPDITFNDHLVTSVGTGGYLSLSNTDFMRINSEGNVFSSRLLSVDDFADSIDIAIVLTTNIIRKYSASTLTSTLTTVLFRTAVQARLPEHTATNTVVASFARLSHTSVNFTVSSDVTTGAFSFDGVALKVANAGVLDYDNGPRTYSFTLITQLNTGSTSITVPVNVDVEILPANDHIPSFITDVGLDYYEFTVFPTTVSHTVCGVVRATDVDPCSQLTFTLDSAAVPYFAVGEHDGIITMVKTTGAVPFVNASNGDESVTFTAMVRDEVPQHTVAIDVKVNLRRTPSRNLGMQFAKSISEAMPVGSSIVFVSVPNHTHYEFASQTGDTAIFNIDPVSGEVSIAATLDRETRDNYMLSVTAREKVNTPTCVLVVLGDLNITVLDANDNEPMFESNAYTGHVGENMPAGTTVQLDRPIRATDKDIGILTFSVTQGSSDFTISSGGIVTTLRPLDRERSATRMLEVMVDDNKHTSNASLTITIDDENDNLPGFQNIPATLSIMEDAAVSQSVLDVSAVDADEGPGAVLTYLLVDGPNEFAIAHHTGSITVSSPLDRERQAQYNLYVMVIDNGNPSRSATANVQINVGDVNDNAPVFSDDSLVFEVIEGIVYSIANPVGRLTVTDTDSGSNAVVRFSTSNILFDVNSTTGTITCAQALDYEGSIQHSLVVVAIDMGNTTKQTSATVVINVRDVNDNTPVVTHANSTRLSQTDFSAIEPFLVVTATDADSGLNGEVDFGLVNSADIFTIDNVGILRTKALSVTPNPQTYMVTIAVADRGVPEQSATSKLYITVTQDTTLPLTFDKSEHKFNVTENQQPGAVVGDVSKSVIGTSVPVYDIPDPSGKFLVDSITGVLTTHVMLDREAQSRHIVFIRVRVGSSAEGDITLVNVTVTDENDNAPVFPRDKYRLTQWEDVTLNTVVQTVEARDDDEGPNADIQFLLRKISGSVCWQDFNINSKTGELSIVKALDYETYTSCVFTVLAYDIGQTPRTSSIIVDITILDVNDNTPTFDSHTYQIQVLENLRVNEQTTVFGTVADADSQENGDIQLFSRVNIDCPFGIRKQTKSLSLSLQSNLDYESRALYTCVVTAIDQPSNGNRLTGTTTVSIYVTDVNDNPPVFSIPQYVVNISRDLNVGEEVIATVATDIDSGLNKQIRYSLKGDEGYLVIDSRTGMVSIGKLLYGYPKDRLSVLVQAADYGVPRLSSEVSLTINISDGNLRPQIALLYSYIQLREETEKTGPLYTVTANDWNGVTFQTCMCTFRLQSPSDVFEVEMLTGEVRMKPGTSLDRERDHDSVDIYIIARDTGSPPKDSNPMHLEIGIIDINDQPPLFRYNSIPLFRVYQNHLIGQVLGKVTATDLDVNPVTLYSITDLFFSASGAFGDKDFTKFELQTMEIDTSTGDISTTRGLDIGLKTTFYIMLAVKAVDANDSLLTDSTPVIIEVKYMDSNIYSPIFDQTIYEQIIERSHPKGVAIVQVSATDRDAIPTNINYSIESGNIRDLMAIDKTTGEVTLAYTIDPTLEIRNITLTVRASDSGGIPKYSTCIVKITLFGDYQQCFSSDMRQEIVTEKDLFMGVMIGLVVALCIAMILCFIFIYKYRVATMAQKVHDMKKSTASPYTGLEPYPSGTHTYRQVHEHGETEGEAEYEVLPEECPNPGDSGIQHTYMSIRDPPATMNLAFERSLDDVNVSFRETNEGTSFEDIQQEA